MTTPTNNLIRIGIILGITFCLFLGITQVKANTFSEVTVGYGYTPVVNGVTGSRSWATYNSSNLVNYGYSMGDTNYYNIDEFNIRFHPSGNFQRGTSYTITFTWENYHPTIDTNNFYADWLLMTHSLLCYSSSWSSSSQSGSNCFTSSNISASQSGTSAIYVTLTFVPSANFYGLALVNQHGSTITFYKSIGWEVYDIGYSYSTDGSQDIINNANQNTQNIINNQDSNTQDIIDNQNANTQAIIDSNKSCQSYDKTSIATDKKYLTSYGYENPNNNFGITNYIKIDSTTSINVLLSTTESVYMCFYNINKTLISCTSENNLSGSVTIPSDSSYFRFSIYKAVNRPQLNVCKNGTQAISDALTDDDVGGSTSSADSFFSNFTTETYGLTSVITAPLTFIQGLTSQTCSALTLPLPYVNQNLQLPCMTTIYQEHFGSFLSLYQTITFGIVSYWVIVRIFNLVKDFKNPDHDEIEVMDL